jgi:hypothetical protein
MKFLPGAFLLILLAACSEKPGAPGRWPDVNTAVAAPPDSKKVDLTLQGGLGTLRFYIPDRYDTQFVFISTTDCIPCDGVVYRFQSKKMPIQTRVSYLGAPVPDTMEWFSIYHPRDVTFAKPDYREHLAPFKGENEGTSGVIHASIREINGRYFGVRVTEIKGRQTKKRFQQATAVTLINGVETKFIYVLDADDSGAYTRNYIANTLRLLKTIQINPGS